jgi:cbb3-type cytochrome oxidase subunit 3
MIIIAIVISIFFIVVIAILCRSYTKDIFELENRLLQLEKRIEDFKKDYKGIYIPINDEMSLLIPLCEKDNFDIEKINYYFSNYGKPSMKIKDKEVDDMACKKGRGGRKK